MLERKLKYHMNELGVLIWDDNAEHIRKLKGEIEENDLCNKIK